MKRWAFIVCAFLVACGPENFMRTEVDHGRLVKVAPVYLQDTWNDGERAYLKDAISAWNHALNGRIRLDVRDERYTYDGSSHGDRLIIIKTDTETADKQDHVSALGWTYGRGGTGGVGGARIFLVADKVHDDDLTFVAMHEIGHALGAGHIEYKGLMNEFFIKRFYECFDGTTLSIDKTALDAVVAYQHVPIDGMRWCK